MSKCRNYGRGVLTLDVINAAAYGDMDSLNFIYKYYEGYIRRISTMKSINSRGICQLSVNEALRGFLEWVVYSTVMKHTFKF